MSARLLVTGVPNPERARQGRREMKRRCIEVALAETPESVKEIRPRKALTGRAFWDSTLGGYVVEVPRPFTRKAVYIFLHELGHVRHDHPRGRRQPSWECEEQAEQFAHETMRRHGLAVPRSMTQRAKEYVAYKRYRGAISNHRHVWHPHPRVNGLEVCNELVPQPDGSSAKCDSTRHAGLGKQRIAEFGRVIGGRR